MDKKAGNEGDKLKHPLLLEVLGRCEGWGRLTYAETHAGAGHYLAAAQNAGLAKDRHIVNLYSLWSKVEQPPAEEDAGGRYYALLRRWWASKRRTATYPGSVLQAALYLKARNQAEFRVTEADEETYDRLVKATRRCGISPEHEKFQKKMDWLTANDSLVLLIDPLKFKQDYGDSREKELNKGGIDIPKLTELLQPCWVKKAAVVLLWCGFGHQTGKLKKGVLHGWLKRMCQRKKASLSCYHDLRSHSAFIIGLGEGKAVVDKLPKDEWSSSWLKRTIRTGP
jgi:hypothetical protein